MTAAALSLPAPTKRRRDPRLEQAIDFINRVESSWKGHESFAMWLVGQVKPKTVVDLGFDRGLSTLALAYRNGGHVFGIDWFENGNYAVKSYALDIAFRNISKAMAFQYVKNVHLIIGPFSEVSKHWNRKIDILHIDWAHTYLSAQKHYEDWSPYVNANGVILIHDICQYPEVGQFFESLPLPKFTFPHAHGLGVATANETLLEKIKKKFGVI